MRRRMRRAAWLVAGALGLLGCQSGEKYEVAPYKAVCLGVGTGLCPLGFKEGSMDATAFTDIEGLTFHWGLIQTARISEEKVKDSPPDVPLVHYVVEDILETRRVPPEAQFDLTLSRDFISGTREGGYQLIDSTPVTCATSEVCDTLEQKLTTAALFSLVMGYPDVEGEPLIIKSFR